MPGCTPEPELVQAPEVHRGSPCAGCASRVHSPNGALRSCRLPVTEARSTFHFPCDKGFPAGVDWGERCGVRRRHDLSLHGA